MNEAIHCPGCAVQLLLPALPDGQTVACPRCQRVFEPARQRATPAAQPAPRPRTPTPIEEPGDDAPVTPQQGRPEEPRGRWRGYLAVTLLAVGGIAFAVQAYCEIELILLIHAQDALGPRQIPNEQDRGELGFALRGRRPAPPPDPRQALLDERWERWEQLAPATNICVVLAFGLALLSLLAWLYRVHKNLPGLKAQGLSYPPAWAFIAFLVPIVNLFVPFAFIQEVWRGSHPHAIGTPQSWRDTPFARSVRIWWLFYVGAAVLWALAFFTTPNFPATYDQLEIGACFATAAGICTAGAAVLLIYIIRKITQRQQLRYGNL